MNLKFERPFQDSSRLPGVQGVPKVKESHLREHMSTDREPKTSILPFPFIPAHEIFSSYFSMLFFSK